MLLINVSLRRPAVIRSDQYKVDAKRTCRSPTEKNLRRRERDFCNEYTDTFPTAANGGSTQTNADSQSTNRERASGVTRTRTARVPSETHMQM